MTAKYLLPSSFKHILGGLAVGSSKDKVFLLPYKDYVTVLNTCATGNARNIWHHPL